jgi:hypothetical protein
MRNLISTLALALAMTACGQPAATNTDAAAEPAAAGATTASGEVTAEERAAILAALSLSADGSGQVINECGDRVTPQFSAQDLGAGRTIAFAIGGGASIASCYGDGPLVQLMRNNGGAWTEIYQNRGGYMIVLSSKHNGANDLADGGPGFSFPVSQWNGSTYESANRQVADSALGDARFIPE